MPLAMHNGLLHNGIVCVRDVCSGFVFTKAIWADSMANISRAVMEIFCWFGPPGKFGGCVVAELDGI